MYYMCYILQGNPLNIHSPRVPCYMCYMCYISQGNPLNIHSPPVPCYMYYMCYISQGNPLNIHSSRVPCYMYYMCYMALYSTYRKLYSTYSKEPVIKVFFAPKRVRSSFCGNAEAVVPQKIIFKLVEGPGPRKGSRPAASQPPVCPVSSAGPPRCRCPAAPAAPASAGSPGPPCCGRSWSPRPPAAARRRTEG